MQETTNFDPVFLADLAAIRRDIHAHPELAFNENRTADIVARAHRSVPVRASAPAANAVAVVDVAARSAHGARALTAADVARIAAAIAASAVFGAVAGSLWVLRHGGPPPPGGVAGNVLAYTATLPGEHHLLFAEIDRYDAVVTSCNAAFKLLCNSFCN